MNVEDVNAKINFIDKEGDITKLDDPKETKGTLISEVIGDYQQSKDQKGKSLAGMMMSSKRDFETTATPDASHI